MRVRGRARVARTGGVGRRHARREGGAGGAHELGELGLRQHRRQRLGALHDLDQRRVDHVHPLLQDLRLHQLVLLALLLALLPDSANSD
mgnify:CR=1 FL=1